MPSHRAALAGRSILVAVLDLDERGPAFGERAFQALAVQGGPLDTVDVTFRRLRYDWDQPRALPAILDGIRAGTAICAISSEGGLFEYGDDAQIRANLESIHGSTPADAIVAGSVTREDEPARLVLAGSGHAIKPRTLEAFARLARPAGWTLDESIERPFSYNVKLMKR